jgi:FHA domain-containing protein
LVMAPQTLLPTPLGPAPAAPRQTDERATAALELHHPAVADALATLDHRSRRRAIPRHHAAPGHYLSFDGSDGEHVLPIDARLLHVGRSSTADVRIEDPHVSRCHAIVVRYGHHVRVLDDRSRAGTYVNGKRIIATDLADGDVVRLGPVPFTYLIVS